MKAAPRSTRVVTVLAASAIALTVALGIVLRLADPLSTKVIPAEDPYNHMALVREHLREGEFNPLNPGALLYPPGLHAFLGAAWAFTGADLYEIVRIGPSILGAIGILGIAVLLWRHGGPVAAFVGALALAVAPEAIFRTTMMSPTALDLALVPFLLFALLETMLGRLQWAGAAGVMSAFLVFSHPWLFGILVSAGIVFVLLALLLPWPASAARRLSPVGVATALFVVGGGLALTLTTCGGNCGPGFRDLFPAVLGMSGLPMLLFVASLIPLALVLWKPRALDRVLARSWAGPQSWWGRGLVSVAFATLLLAVTIPALNQGLPEHVDLPKMFGWPILVLAAFAVVALPFIARPTAYLGVAIAAATYPMVMYNLLDSPFWPHRTAVFLGIGLVILAGTAAAAIARGAVLAWHAASRSLSKTPHVHARPAVVLVPALLAVAFLGGTVYAGTPDGYPGGWYRMYHECDLNAFQDIADQANAQPDAVVITGSWQSKLVLAAITEDASRVWMKSTFFTLPDSAKDTAALMQKENRPVIVVLDRYVSSENPGADTAFLDSPPWHQAGTWCSGMGVAAPRIVTYELDGVSQ